MPKGKTHKATAKRFSVRKSKKNGVTKVTILKRTDGQDHFNARETGNTKRNKRRDKHMSPTLEKTILRAMPHI